MKKEKYLTPYQFRKELIKKGKSYTIDTIWRWVREKSIVSIKPTPSSKLYLIPRKELDKILAPFPKRKSNT